MPSKEPVFQKTQIVIANLRAAMPPLCDVCGKRRGGSRGKIISHVKCSQIRQQRGFLPARGTHK